MQDRQLCSHCVYYVKNLPRDRYPKEEWELLEELECSIDALPGDELCKVFRKTSCDIVSLEEEK